MYVAVKRSKKERTALHVVDWRTEAMLSDDYCIQQMSNKTKTYANLGLSFAF